MKLKGVWLLVVLLLLCYFVNAERRSELVNNSLKEIEACKGKLKLKLIRIWGGDEEEDEKKFFKNPTCVAVDKNRLVYICDTHGHVIKIFNNSGKYVRTIGRKGKGPGDLYSPHSIALSPNGDLVVYELGGCRIQYFTPEGKSKKIIKSKYLSMGWIGVTSKDELAVYIHEKTFQSKKLISIFNKMGEEIREIGTYHDKSKIEMLSEKLAFALDDRDNIYAANMFTPVIRKYSPDGRLLIAITFETPYEIPPVEITINSRGDEIKRVEADENTEAVQAKGKKGGITIQRVQKKGKRRKGVSWAIGVDRQENIYIVTRKRLLTEKEIRAGVVYGNLDVIKRDRVDFDIIENIDANRVLVFNPQGKVIAEAPLTTFCDGIHINGNRLFIVDGQLNQRILEYEMSFKQ